MFDWPGENGGTISGVFRLGDNAEIECATCDMRADIERWRHPVLFIQGQDDPYGSQGQADAAALSDRAKIVALEDCAHSPHLEDSDRTVRLIQAFVSGAVEER